MNEELKIIITAEIDKLKKELKNGQEEVKKFGNKSKTSFKDFNDAVQKAGDVAKKGMAIAAASIAGAATALLALSSSTKEYRINQSKLNSAFEAAGSSAGTAKGVYEGLFRVLGDDDVAVEAANHLAKLTTNQQDLSQWTKICQGVYATFGDSLPIEGLTEAANETARVGKVTGPLADALNWAGVSEDNFNAKLEKCNSTAEREALIRETLTGLYDEAAGNYEKNAESILAQNEAQAKLNENMAKIGETMAPINAALSQFAADILAKLAPHIEAFINEHGPAIQETLTKVADAIGSVINWIVSNWDFVSTLAIIITGIAVALGVFSTAMGIVNAVMTASPVTWIVLGIVAALAALIAIIVVVIKHWDDIKTAVKTAAEAIGNAVSSMVSKVTGFFKNLWNGITNTVEGIKNSIVNKFNAVKSTVTNIFNGVKSAIMKPIEAAKNFVGKTIDKIKSFFSFKVELPKIKLPHFGITPKGWKIGDLLKGSIPKLGIDWYAKGGVFEKPTAFGMNGNNVMVGGEAGAEAIVPLEKNTEWLDKIADRLASRGSKTPIVLNVDGKTFAQTSINTINELTKQTGSLNLNII